MEAKGGRRKIPPLQVTQVQRRMPWNELWQMRPPPQPMLPPTDEQIKKNPTIYIHYEYKLFLQAGTEADLHDPDPPCTRNNFYSSLHNYSPAHASEWIRIVIEKCSRPDPDMDTAIDIDYIVDDAIRAYSTLIGHYITRGSPEKANQIVEFLKTDYSHDMDTDDRYIKNRYRIILLFMEYFLFISVIGFVSSDPIYMEVIESLVRTYSSASIFHSQPSEESEESRIIIPLIIKLLLQGQPDIVEVYTDKDIPMPKAHFLAYILNTQEIDLRVQHPTIPVIVEQIERLPGYMRVKANKMYQKILEEIRTQLVDRVSLLNAILIHQQPYYPMASQNAEQFKASLQTAQQIGDDSDSSGGKKRNNNSKSYSKKIKKKNKNNKNNKKTRRSRLAKSKIK